jgi:hypothetical protein
LIIKKEIEGEFGSAIQLSVEEQVHRTEWQNFIRDYEFSTVKSFSALQISKLLNQIQEFVRAGIPADVHYDQKLKTATDEIFQASMLLTEKDAGNLLPSALEAVTRHLYLAIKALLE